MIKLTNRDGQDVWLNPDTVNMVRPSTSYSGGTDIYDARNSHILIVQESPVDVAARVSATRSRRYDPAV